MDTPRLQVTDTLGQRTVPLDTSPLTIGRRSNCDLQVVGTDVSREHAEIRLADGQCLLRDRESRFGTFVNGDPVTAERALAHGDRIRLGRTDAAELVFLTRRDEPALIPLDPHSGIPDLRQMSALLDGLRALGSGRVLDDVLTTVVDLAIDVTSADRGFVMLADVQGGLAFKTARLHGRTTLVGGAFDTSHKIPEEVFRSGRTRVVENLTDDTQAGGHQGTIALGIRHVLCAPLRVVQAADADAARREQVIGVLYLDGRARGTFLSRSTQDALETFATQAAMAIESARLYAESAEKARLEHEMTIAGEIQQGLLPDPEYRGATFDLAATSIPCRTVGGDFFDYAELDGGAFACSLGDVAGKGPPAALLATAVQSLTAAQAAVTSDPVETLTRVNRGLLRRAIQSRFATMFYGVLSPDGSLRYSCAGHEPPVLIRRAGTESLEAGGLVLGLFPHATYEPGLVQMDPGDVVVVCSDGVTEAWGPDEEEFGRERLVSCVQATHGLAPAEIRERLLQAVREYTAGAAPADDLTVVVLRYRGA
jgi:sigma-B regulation protein RsbU (phosphoserine phosphatase)